MDFEFEELISKHRYRNPFNDSNDKFTYYSKRNFERLLETSPSSIEVLVNGVKIQAIVNDIKYGVEDNDDKYLLVRHSNVLKIGSMVECLNSKWIISAQERLTDKGHLSYRLKRCNATLNFINKLGMKVTQDCYAYNKLFYTEGIDKYTSITMPDGLMQVIVPDTEDTRAITRNVRLTLGGQAFICTYVDTITQSGVIQITLTERLLDPSDNVKDEISDNEYLDGIKGRDYIFLDTSAKYETVIDVDKWTIDGECIEIISSTHNSAIIKGIKPGISYILCECDKYILKKEISVTYRDFD